MAKTSEALPGAVFSRWTVLAQHIKFRERHALVVCSCGTIKSLTLDHLGQKRHHSHSCGCLRKDALSALGLRNRLGLTTTDSERAYASWRNMLDRVSPNASSKPDKYKSMAPPEEWRKFENFYRDMGPCPEGMTLDRKDTTKGYSAENCKWSTRAEQVRNRECVRFFKKGEEVLTMTDLAKRLSISPTGVRYRANRAINLDGWVEIPYTEAITLSLK